MSIDPRFFRKRTDAHTFELISINLDSQRDVLGDLFAQRDAAKRIDKMPKNKPRKERKPTPTKKPAAWPAPAPRIPQPRPQPTPIKPITERPNPFLISDQEQSS